MKKKTADKAARRKTPDQCTSTELTEEKEKRKRASNLIQEARTSQRAKLCIIAVTAPMDHSICVQLP